ncbi:MAG: hypothetical protein PHP44_06020, partial [Kiritimatiellae bacterium]|nr:hypothetical protein [Kiritimatiellia bacterium]
AELASVSPSPFMVTEAQRMTSNYSSVFPAFSFTAKWHNYSGGYTSDSTKNPFLTIYLGFQPIFAQILVLPDFHDETRQNHEKTQEIQWGTQKSRKEKNIHLAEHAEGAERCSSKPGKSLRPSRSEKCISQREPPVFEMRSDRGLSSRTGIIATKRRSDSFDLQ